MRLTLNKQSNVKVKKRKESSVLTPWLFLLPALLMISVFYIYPILQAFMWSVQDYKIIAGEGAFVGLDNFRYIFQDSLFWRALTNSLLFLVVVLPLNVFLPIIVASAVNQKVKGIGLFRVIYYSPVVTPMVVAALMWRMLYVESGFVGNLVHFLGLYDRPTNLLMQTSTALFAVTVITVWKGLGYYMMIYLAGLQSISDEVYEAASIDGASPIQKFFKITVPMLAPSITLVSIMTIINGLKVFEEIALTTGGGPAGATTTLVIYIFDKFRNLEVSTASAAGIVLLVLAATGSVIQLKLNSGKEKDLKG
ncbi:carbohydrate ABC transporter permease [Alkalibacterium sp. 20]|uniref:carbohydrate ABC transporter permease n=1 Tax=Alkalibacterium sp. 20 TaxID=1798803 RepID=UPI000920E38A|nr:sugar ABC transporter permease [Alkalibacterium sp. 20]OJF92123.1 lactose ABC transporter permease [Alkalibacterium sp. 20]